jgi:Xaa-Pro aminopeptidase
MVLLNRDRALALMRRSDLDAIVATSPRNVLYFSDYYCWLDPLFKAYMMRPGAPAELSHNLGLLSASGEPALIVPSIWAANAAHSWIHDIWSHGSGDLDLSAVPAALDADAADLLQRLEAGRTRADGIEALRDLVAERGISSGRIGIELEGLSPSERQRIHEALPRADVRDCSNLLRAIRMVKSMEEIARLERSTRINYEAAKATLSTAIEGTSISELRHDYVSYVVDADAQLDHFIASPRGIGIQEMPDYRLVRGDVLYVDYGCIFQHYYSDNGTTLVVGGFPAQMERRYDVLRDGLQSAIVQLRPGVAASDVRRAMIDVLADGGITGSNAHGHGIGLEVRDYPIIMPDSGLRIRDDCIDIPADVPLEADMVVNLELPLFLFGAGSLHMEQTFLITPDGCRRLDSDEPTHPIQVEVEAVSV